MDGMVESNREAVQSCHKVLDLLSNPHGQLVPHKDLVEATGAAVAKFGSLASKISSGNGRQGHARFRQRIKKPMPLFDSNLFRDSPASAAAAGKTSSPGPSTSLQLFPRYQQMEASSSKDPVRIPAAQFPQRMVEPNPSVGSNGPAPRAPRPPPPPPPPHLAQPVSVAPPAGTPAPALPAAHLHFIQQQQSYQRFQLMHQMKLQSEMMKRGGHGTSRWRPPPPRTLSGSQQPNSPREWLWRTRRSVRMDRLPARRAHTSPRGGTPAPALPAAHLHFIQQQQSYQRFQLMHQMKLQSEMMKRGGHGDQGGSAGAGKGVNLKFDGSNCTGSSSRSFLTSLSMEGSMASLDGSRSSRPFQLVSGSQTSSTPELGLMQQRRRGYYKCSSVRGCPARKHVERPMLGLRHWVATVPKDEDDEAGCRGTALAAAGEGGEEGRLP
ncbi:Protein WRKY1 [Triticum urartu]|uniref:Protein WRKY1 n=1 Tax=Triticum urartu TaxID=4572 RepID=M7ZMD3_TRIUA|nr:Protein WRKY1 [Triticum urartu]